MNYTILDCVNEFWSNLDIDGELLINNEQMSSIYFYIVIRSKITDFFAHISFMKAFMPLYMKQSKIGFILLTYDRALHTLLELNNDDSRFSEKTEIMKLIDSSIESEEPLSETFTVENSLRMTMIPDAMKASIYSPFEEMERSKSFAED